MQEQQQREKQFSVEPTFISHSSFSQIAHFPVAETPCFFINQIQLHPSTDNTFAFLIPKLLKRLSIPASLCVGEKNLKLIQETAQNILIEQGFITSHLYFDNQDLNSQTLFLSVQAGINGGKFTKH